MGHIRQLSENLANKIAAGEVVERPASVIKELTENSIDAKAKSITILVEQGGTSKMCVIDDGIGMNRADALLCFSRHATSKIVGENDLFNITTLGFRGEAIPSIASISVFTLETNNGEENTKVEYEFGKRKNVGSVAMNRGTKITVERIFQNVPARLKYMKSINAEFAAIYSYVERLALAHPEISFTLIHDHKTIFKTNGRNNLLEVISEIYGIPVAKNMIHVDFGNEEFHVAGYISKIDTSRSSKNHIVTLVNHRYVKNMKTINTINEVYRRYLADKRYPIAVLEIDVDPYLVDVNVHPAKLEVRFSKETELKELLLKGLEEALSKKNLTYKPSTRETEKASFKPSLAQMTIPLDEVFEEVKEEPVIETVHEEMPVYEPEKVEIKESPKEEPLKPIKEKIKVIGQTRGTYILGENERGFYIIDQHAAHEKVYYERFVKLFQSQNIQSQYVSPPLIVSLSLEEENLLKANEKYFRDFGFEIEPFGGREYSISAVPSSLLGMTEEELFLEMLDHLTADGSKDAFELFTARLATMACKAAVKGNHSMSPQEADKLIDELLTLENPYFCPHGRPVIVSMTKYEIEKKFKRIV